MMKWRVREINLWNFRQNLNENLYLPIFEKEIHSKYLENSRMVLSIPWNDDKIFGNKLAELFPYKCILKLYCLIQFFWRKSPLDFRKAVVIFSVIPTVSYSPEQSFSALWRPKTNVKSIVGQDCLSHMAVLRIERTFANRLDTEKVADEFSSKNARSKFFFQPIFRPKNISDLNIAKKVNELIQCWSKGILGLAINKNPKLKLFFVPIINRCLSSL